MIHKRFSLSQYRAFAVQFIVAVFISLLFTSFAAHSDTRQTFTSGEYQAQLIELYTSQGCSSCPRAERWLNKFIDHPDLWDTVIPLAFHVDYWDYLGWKDPFSSAIYSQRQGNYKLKAKVNSIYTPGFVVNGEEWKGYYNAKSLPELKPTKVKLEATLKSDTLNVTFTPFVNQPSLPIDINFAVLGLGIQTKVTKGENAHRDLVQEFVALHLESIRSSTGVEQYTLPDFQQEGIERYAIAVWASDPKSLDLIQAVGGWLK